MPATERPKLLLFTPYATTARINSTLYVNDQAHTDTRYLIADLNGATEATALVGSGTTNFNVTGLTLNVGETYTARVQYLNATGPSIWSSVFAATVFSSGFDLPPTIVQPNLPGVSSTPIPLAIAPSYRAELENKRGLVTHVSQGGHTVRRLTSGAGTVLVRLQWFALTLAQRDTVLAVLEDSLGSFDSNDVRGFDFSTVASTPRPLDGISFLPVKGSIIQREMQPGVFEVSIDATEILP